MQLQRILRFIPPKYRMWASIALIVILAVAQQLGLISGENGSRQSSLQTGGEIVGRAKAVDGDSLKIRGDEVRMVGIDAPEGRQTCQKNGRDWDCGNASRTFLISMIGGRDVTCTFDKRDKHDRALGTCHAGGVNLNREMVRRGYAVSYGRYRADESAAKSAKRGIWAGQFQRPKQWRADRGIGR